MDALRREKNGTCGTLRECITLAAHISAAGRCSIPHLPYTFILVAAGATQRPQRLFLAWHSKLCMSAYTTLSDLALSHPFLPCSPALDYVTHMGCSQAVCFSSECCWEAGAPWYRLWLSLGALCQTQLHPPDSRARHCAASPEAGGDKTLRCVMTQ